MTVPSHAMPSAAALRVEAVVKTLSGRRVLDGVGLEISRGQVYGLVGPNGAGKTTLLRCIVGFSRPQHGRILVEGRDVGRRPAAARERVGALIDRPGFYPFLTGAENLRELMLARGQRPDATVVREALRRVGLLDDLYRGQFVSAVEQERNRVADWNHCAGFMLALEFGADARGNFHLRWREQVREIVKIDRSEHH